MRCGPLCNICSNATAVAIGAVVLQPKSYLSTEMSTSAAKALMYHEMHCGTELSKQMHAVPMYPYRIHERNQKRRQEK